MLNRKEIRIRDPFILAENGRYYMYGTTDLGEGYAANSRFSVYVSKDLENFEGPYVVFDGEKEGFWADRDYWAAEVWKYRGRYYLFGSFKSEKRRRASCILASDSPMGPFRAVGNTPVTPEAWECLDGTLWVENGVPYMVFCHEWVQCGDGEICAVRLSEDLSRAEGEPFLLFKASENPYVTAFNEKGDKVTDGPFLFAEKGKVKMIWSSYDGKNYSVFEACADGITGKWEHGKSLFDCDGGHAMIFETFDGKKYFSLHNPNTPPNERATFIPYES